MAVSVSAYQNVADPQVRRRVELVHRTTKLRVTETSPRVFCMMRNRFGLVAVECDRTTMGP
jgi:hypothetical protein